MEEDVLRQKEAVSGTFDTTSVWLYRWGLLYKSHRRGFRVARSTTSGNAKASTGGAGNEVGSPRFFFL